MPSLLPTGGNIQFSTTTKVLLFSSGMLLFSYLRYRRQCRLVPIPYDDAISTTESKNSSQSQNSVVPATDSIQIVNAATKQCDNHERAHQLGLLGIETLRTVIILWGHAADQYTDNHNDADGDSDGEICRELKSLVELSQILRKTSELVFLEQPFGTSAPPTDPENVENLELTRSESTNSRIESIPSSLSVDSFVSATCQISDRKLKEFEKYPLFQVALKRHEESPIPYRTIRTELVHCSNDTEYLAKLHCIRKAFQYLFKDRALLQWIKEVIQQILTDLVSHANKDTEEFLVAYEDMVNFLQKPNSWNNIRVELEARNVEVLCFYDIFIEFLILESFCDFEEPPESVRSVLQNRWLSPTFKEKSLTRAVWSSLAEKMQLLEYPNGLMAHFYLVSKQILPLMSWGFFGTNENLRVTCHYCKDQFLGCLKDMFSFEKTRYTTIEELCQDIMKHMQTRVNNIGTKFNQ